MPTLTDQEIAQHAYNAGFRGDMLDTAIAVALAESRGRTGAIGDVHLETSKWGPSVGLWQIRSLNPGHGTALEQSQRDQTANLDPATNAANAYAISGNGTSFRQWSTYTNGDYRQFLDRARTASGAVTGTAPVPEREDPHRADPPRPAPAPSRTPQAPAQQAFHARGGTLGPLAQTLHTQGGELRTLQGQLPTRLPAEAFGRVPESASVHQAHASTLNSLAQSLGQAGEEITGVGDNVLKARENYLRQDKQHADNYRQTILRLFNTQVR
ncbi:hypothetical protein JOF53_000391 [Crossiella equi]|uniref:Transglycosylase SLT domain-containing protein n=1 Tax=Crossiella equi TaxID=130796 RepID=A0ABS5A5N1_9PSEU|nr:hypothetical protein [Crossiella equi]MBP2471519.1 hypothetical protein [Crossiella equi]